MKYNNKELLAIVLICLVVSCAYLNSLPNRFIFDDNHMVLENNYIKNIKHAPLFFKGETTSSTIARGMYRPLLMLSFMFNYLTGGLNPHGYHIINILLHFVNAVLLFFLLKLFLKGLSLSLRLGITLIFCLHPINTEAVAYISSRSDLLSSFFILAAIYSYVRFRASGYFRGYYLSLGLYVLALLSKETALVLPGLIIAYELVYTPWLNKQSQPNELPAQTKQLGRPMLIEFRTIFLRLLPFILITAGYLILRQNLFGSMLRAQISYVNSRPFSANILTQSAVSFFYIYLFFFPFNLCIDHSFPIITSFSNPLGLISLVLILLIVGACLVFRKRIAPLIGFSCLWYFISLLPKFYARLNFVSAEHHTYLAFFSAYFILGYLILKLNNAELHGNRKFLKNILLRQFFFLILGLFFVLTFLRNSQWRNEYLLWKYTLKTNPNSNLAKGSLGLYLANTSSAQDAEEYLKQSAASASIGNTKVASTLNLAYYYASQNKPRESFRILRENEEELKKANFVGFCRALSFAYWQVGEHEKAKHLLEELLRVYSHDAKTKGVLGWQYLQAFPDKQKAKYYFQAALEDDPSLAFVRLGLAAVYEKEKNWQQAIEEYQAVIKILPRQTQAYYNLGLIYAQKLLSPKAEYYLKKTITLAPNFAPAYYSLCIYYLSLPEPNFSKAEENFNKAIELGFKPDPEIVNALRLKKLPLVQEEK